MVAAQLAQASWVASTRRHRLLLEPPGRPKWVWLLFAPLFLLNTPHFVFGWFLSETLQNFTDYVTSHFLSELLWNITDYATTPFLTSGMFQNFTDCATMLPFDFRHVVKLHGLPKLFLLFIIKIKKMFTKYELFSFSCTFFFVFSLIFPASEPNAIHEEEIGRI